MPLGGLSTPLEPNPPPHTPRHQRRARPTGRRLARAGAIVARRSLGPQL